MRKRTKFFIWIAAGSFIGYIFLQWGMNITGRTRVNPMERGVIAEVNGEPISSSDYRNEIERFVAEQAERMGVEELSEEMMEVAYEQAFDALVSRVLLEQEVRRRNIGVTDEEVLNVVRYSPPEEFLTMEEFQTEGQFDYDKYHELLADPRSQSFLLDYERRIRESLPLQKLQMLIISSAKVTEPQVRREYLLRSEEVTVEYLFLPPDTTYQVEVAEEEIVEYYTTHEEELRQPEKAMLSYVSFEVKASDQDERDVKQRIEEVYEEAMSGADFGDLALYYSEDPQTASNGGDLGWFSEGTMVKEFEEVAFSLESGQISRPFKSVYGWHIVAVEARRRDEVKASHILLKVGPSAETIENIRNAVREFVDDAHSTGFEEAAFKHSTAVQTTEEFSLDVPYIPGFGFSEDVVRFISEGKTGDIAYPIGRGNTYYIFKIIRKIPAKVPELEEVRIDLESSVRLEKQRARAGEKASLIRRQIGDGSTLHAVAEQNGLVVKRLRGLTRLSNIPGVSPRSEFFGAAFSLEEGKVSAPVGTNDGYFIIKVVEHHPIDEERFNAERDRLWAELLQKEQQRLYVAWVSNLKASAKIEDHRRTFF